VLNIEIRDGVRYLVQENEEVQGERLLKKVYENGALFYDEDDIAAINQARQQLLATLPLIALPTRESEKTQLLHQEVRAKLLSNMDRGQPFLSPSMQSSRSSQTIPQAAYATELV
jgi:hypothetical protein